MNAIETTGTIDASHQLRLDAPLSLPGDSQVRVIILVPETADVQEAVWLKAASANTTFDFLKDPAEEVYCATDGKPFHDQG